MQSALAWPRGSGARPHVISATFEWQGVRRCGNLDLDELHSAASLLEALVELGEVLLGSGVISAAQSQVRAAQHPTGRPQCASSHSCTAHAKCMIPPPPPNVSQVYYVTAAGATKKMYVTKTRWADLLDCKGLMVYIYKLGE